MCQRNDTLFTYCVSSCKTPSSPHWRRLPTPELAEVASMSIFLKHGRLILAWELLHSLVPLFSPDVSPWLTCHCSVLPSPKRWSLPTLPEVAPFTPHPRQPVTFYPTDLVYFLHNVLAITEITFSVYTVSSPTIGQTPETETSSTLFTTISLVPRMVPGT